MSAEYDRGTFLLQFQDHIFQDVCIHRIKAGEWFIQNNDLRIVQDGGNELQFLPHSLAEGFHLLLPVPLQVKPLQPVINLSSQIGPFIQFSVELKQFTQFHFLVQAPLFWKVAHILKAPGVMFPSIDTDRTPVRIHDLHDHADGGSLA